MTSGLQKMSLSKLDGIRGIAAVIVIFSHALFWYYPAMHLGERTKGRPLDGIEWFDSPFSFFYRGGFSVSVFFILSGLVLTYSISRHADVVNSIRKASLKRYIRLGVPVAASVLIGCALMKLGIYEAPKVSPIPVLSTPYLFNATWDGAIRDAIYGALALGDSRYNYVLWTIQIELIGSFAIFAAFALFGGNAFVYRLFCILAFLVLSASTNKTAMYTSLFFLGSMLITFRFNEEKPSIKRTVICMAGLLIGLYLAGFHSASASYEMLNTITRALSAITGYQPSWLLIMPALGGLVILLSVLNAQRTFAVLDSAPMKWLGKLSFSLYLLHTFILVVVAQFFTKHFGMSFPAMIMTLSTTLILTLIASYFFHLKVDLPAITLANKFSSLLLGTKEKAAKAEGNQQQPAQA
ncbi:putative acyltransferase [Pseudomonas putida]|uniref:Acyltransferase n=2 Tax=Pseudomonas TaxID=286 RepID=A0ABM7EJ08_PSEPU|nr:acyltransferase family protein [Pseudomonas sp. SDS3-8]BAN55830.1 putative acyltransferase [Pseudomonas putida NBRC 14164]SUD74837.1 putative acyltransferase [Pseudomonas putida]